MVPLKVLTLVVAGQNQPSVLVLQPVEETPAGKARIVPIWIGPTEAAQIGMALEHVKFARPMTHDLMLDALTNLDARVDSMVIYGSKGQMFFAHLALRQDAPLHIEETVLDASSFPFLFKGEKQTEEELAAFKTFLDPISPEDFGDIEQL